MLARAAAMMRRAPRAARDDAARAGEATTSFLEFRQK
jgi:hypothetical protein